MKCEMYWGGVPCKSKNTILVNVKLASGEDKKIYMCPSCHYKYFGKRQRRPTQRALDLLSGAAKSAGSAQPANTAAGNTNRWLDLLKGK